jgi:hypothetical protein
MTTTMIAAAARGQRQPLTAWCGAGVRQPEAVEMEIKQKWEQCNDKWKFYLVKLLRGYCLGAAKKNNM